jgi:hypothetical protein
MNPALRTNPNRVDVRCEDCARDLGPAAPVLMVAALDRKGWELIGLGQRRPSARPGPKPLRGLVTENTSHPRRPDHQPAPCAGPGGRAYVPPLQALGTASAPGAVRAGCGGPRCRPKRCLPEPQLDAHRDRPRASRAASWKPAPRRGPVDSAGWSVIACGTAVSRDEKSSFQLYRDDAIAHSVNFFVSPSTPAVPRAGYPPLGSGGPTPFGHRPASGEPMRSSGRGRSAHPSSCT